MRKRARAVHMLYPHLQRLECLVYSASGYNKGKEMWKSSFHLVWSQLIVDGDRALVVRYVTLGVFAKETENVGSFLSVLNQSLINLHKSNDSGNAFDKTTVHAGHGLRLPYCDKASMIIDNEENKKKVHAHELSRNKAPKRRVQEGRPVVAVGKIRSEFDSDVPTEAKWVADVQDHSIAQWIAMGTCRRDPHSRPELTAWQLGPDVQQMLVDETVMGVVSVIGLVIDMNPEGLSQRHAACRNRYTGDKQKQHTHCSNHHAGDKHFQTCRYLYMFPPVFREFQSIIFDEVAMDVI